jgi:hypothetical protein
VSELGYLAAAYVLTGAAFGAYLLSLARRHRSAEHRIARAGGAAHVQMPQAPQAPSRGTGGLSRG